MTKFISAVLLLQLFPAGIAEECASSETSVLLQMGWWHGVEGQAKSKQLEDTPPVDPAYGDDDLGLGTGDLMHPLISLDGALIRQPQSGKGIFHGGITWDSPHWQRHRKLPKGWRMHEILNSAEFFDWVALGLAMILAYIFRHYWLWQVAGEKQMASHGVSLLIWLGLGGALALAISLRFGKGHGEEWIAGYFFEFFFMLENVFVFRAVITALSLSDALVAKVLDWVVNCQIIFEAVFFLGLAHQLRALHLLPQVLGLGLLFFGLLTLRESFAKSKAESGVTSVLRSLSSSSLAGSVDGQENKDFLCFKESRPKLTMGGTVLLLLLLVDFLCEIDTVLTKIEEIQSPFVAFSSSAMAAFALPELYMLSQDLLFHFPLVKYGMGLILCLLGCQMILAPIVLLQPLLTCGMMLAIILLFVSISAVMRPKGELEVDEGIQEAS